MQKTLTYVFGGVLVAVGLLGFVSDPVLGYFEVDLIHNLVHIVTGAVLIWLAMSKEDMLGMGLKVVGVVYAAVAVLGLVMGEGILLGIMEVNAFDNYLHLLLAVVFLYMGFVMKSGTVVAPTSSTPAMM